jgi:hypothetical protein
LTRLVGTFRDWTALDPLSWSPICRARRESGRSAIASSVSPSVARTGARGAIVELRQQEPFCPAITCEERAARHATAALRQDRIMNGKAAEAEEFVCRGSHGRRCERRRRAAGKPRRSGLHLAETRPHGRGRWSFASAEPVSEAATGGHGCRTAAPIAAVDGAVADGPTRRRGVNLVRVGDGLGLPHRAETWPS